MIFKKFDGVFVLILLKIGKYRRWNFRKNPKQTSLTMVQSFFALNKSVLAKATLGLHLRVFAGASGIGTSHLSQLCFGAESW